MLKRLADFAPNTVRGADANALADLAERAVSDRFSVTGEFWYDASFLPPKKALALNRALRGKEYVPDVLALSFWETRGAGEEEPENSGASPVLGELLLCPAAIAAHAREYGAPFARELARMLVHGLLHLLDFDHEVSAGAEYAVLTVQDEISAAVYGGYLADGRKTQGPARAPRLA